LSIVIITFLEPVIIEKVVKAQITPIYCAYMGLWEKKVIEESLSRGKNVPRMWCRFVDNVWRVWKGDVRSFLEFVDYCNNFEPRIKVTHQICLKEAIFLDMKVTRMDNGRIKTKLHVKVTDRQRYLHVSSDHPLHTKKGIAKGQLRRLRRICSDETDFKESAWALGKKMKLRGYKKGVVEGEFMKMKQKN
jgi:hypothetical protein